jgi:hypothetical protein
MDLPDDLARYSASEIALGAGLYTQYIQYIVERINGRICLTKVYKIGIIFCREYNK